MDKGHYESVYLVANHPSAPIAAWIRYTVHKPPNRPAKGSVWFTLFERSGPTAIKVSTDVLRTDPARFLVLDDYGSIRNDGADGAVSAPDGTSASWDLQFVTRESEWKHFPYTWMYRAALPKTKVTSPCPAMHVNGTLNVAGQDVVLDGWPGMLGHNWGVEHAHRWIWLRGAAFEDHHDAWLDVALGRVKVGSRVLPWIANGALALEGPNGPRQRIGGLRHRVSVRERSDGCDLEVPGRDVSLSVQVNAPIATSVGWEYADPSGGRHQVRNCSIAEITVHVRSGRDRGEGHLHSPHLGVYELGCSDFDPQIATQPYPDG